MQNLKNHFNSRAELKRRKARREKELDDLIFWLLVLLLMARQCRSVAAMDWRPPRGPC